MMRSLFRLLFFVVLLSGFSVVNAPAQSAQKQGTSIITGRVTLKDKGMANVAVLLYPADPVNRTTVARTATDTEGQYRLMGVPAGRYTIVAFAPAMVGPNEGTYGEGGKTVTLAEGETVEKIDFALVKGGVITGRVTDTDGTPVIGEYVNLSSVDKNQGRSNSYSFFNPYMYQTDDRGVYRLYGIPAGRYTISVGQSPNSGEVRVGFGGHGYYARTFYPSVTDESKATVIEVTEGSEASNIDITPGRKAQSFVASGRIVDDSGQPVSNIFVGYGTLTPDGKRIGASGYSGAATDAQGRFRLDGLLPGRYAAFSVSLGQSDGYSDPVAFEVTDADVSGLEVKFHHGSSISGTVVIEGTTDQSVLAQLSKLPLGTTTTPENDTLAVPSFSSDTRIAADGSFNIMGVHPGKVRFFLSAYPQINGLTLARVELNGVPQREIEVGPGAQMTGVRVVLEYGTGSVRGVVRFENGSLPEGVRLNVLVRRANDANAFTRRGAEVDSRGSFLIEGLASGDYELTLGIYVPNGTARPRLPPFKQVVTVTNGAESEVTFTLDLNALPKEGGNNE